MKGSNQINSRIGFSSPRHQQELEFSNAKSSESLLWNTTIGRSDDSGTNRNIPEMLGQNMAVQIERLNLKVDRVQRIRQLFESQGE